MKLLMLKPRRKATRSPVKNAMLIVITVTRRAIRKPSAGPREEETRVEVSNGKAKKTRTRRNRMPQRLQRNCHLTSRHGPLLEKSRTMLSLRFQFWPCRITLGVYIASYMIWGH